MKPSIRKVIHVENVELLDDLEQHLVNLMTIANIELGKFQLRNLAKHLVANGAVTKINA